MSVSSVFSSGSTACFLSLSLSLSDLVRDQSEKEKGVGELSVRKTRLPRSSLRDNYVFSRFSDLDHKIFKEDLVYVDRITKILSSF